MGNMLERPLLFPFQSPISRGFSPFARAATEAAGPTQMLNVQKLSQAPSTSVGTQVAVTDGFVVSGFGDAKDGFYFAYDVYTGKSRYIKSLPFANDGTDYECRYTGDAWAFVDPNDTYTAATGEPDFPWSANWSGLGITLTHPAIQQLTAPSTAQGGVFVSGGSQDGVYTKRDLDGARDTYDLLGTADNPDEFSVSWRSIDAGSAWVILVVEDNTYYSLSDVATPDLAGSDKFVMAASGVAYSQRGTFNGKPYFNKIGSTTSTALNAIFWSSATWHISNAIGVDLDTSTSAVATPDLATFLLGTVVTNTAWLNASDDSTASITVTSVTQGELAAGLKIGTDTFQVNGSENGRPKYSDVLGVAEPVKWSTDNSQWEYLTGPSVLNEGNVAFPFQGTPATPVTRDDVASEANWSVVP